MLSYSQQIIFADVFANITLDRQKTITEKRMFFHKNGVDRAYRDEVSFSLNKDGIKCKEITTYVARLRVSKTLQYVY